MLTSVQSMPILSNLPLLLPRLLVALLVTKKTRLPSFRRYCSVSPALPMTWSPSQMTPSQLQLPRV